MLGILTHNLGWKLLSLAAAVAIWMAVASEPELATLSTVPVEYKGEPDDLEISSDVLQNVTVETRGRAHAEEIFRALRDEGYRPVPMQSGAALE